MCCTAWPYLYISLNCNTTPGVACRVATHNNHQIIAQRTRLLRMTLVPISPPTRTHKCTHPQAIPHICPLGRPPCIPMSSPGNPARAASKSKPSSILSDPFPPPPPPLPPLLPPLVPAPGLRPSGAVPVPPHCCRRPCEGAAAERRLCRPSSLSSAPRVRDLVNIRQGVGGAGSCQWK